MKIITTFSLGLLLGLAPMARADVAAIIAQFPAQDGATANQLFEELLHEGGDAIEQLCTQLVPLGAGDDNAPRYALNGLARYVSGPDGEHGQELVEEALLEALETTENAEVKHFLLRQLQQCGTNEAVSEIEGLLLDDATASHTILALDAIGTRRAKRALSGTLDDTAGDTQLEILSALADDGRNRRAANTAEKRLAAGPGADECVHLLSILVALKGDGAHEDLITAMDREEPRCRKAALSHASTMMDKYAVKKWRKKLVDEDTPDDVKREIGGLLADYEAGM